MQVGIAQSFFAKSLNDYQDWNWAWVRELAQNGIDAGSKNISINLESTYSGNTVAVCENDGPPMDRETLLDKFLCVGGTTKDFDGSVGGFGIAKLVIAFAHLSYKIETGNLVVEGSGGEFDISESDDYVDGVRTTVVMEGDQVDRIKQSCYLFTRYAQWSGTFSVNGEVLSCDQVKGARRRDLEFGTVYTNKSDSYRLVVRIGGIPMFVQHCGHDRLVIVELSGHSDQVLTSNRDGLVGPFRGELSDFVTQLSVDKKSALRPNTPRYEYFGGSKLGYVRESSCNIRELVGEVAESPEAGVIVPSPVDSHGPVDSSGSSRFVDSNSDARRRVQVDSEFVIKNESGLVVPSYYRPDSSEFSDYSRKLVKIWGRLLVQLHRLFDSEAAFGVGFVFDDDTVAEYESGQYGAVYYISPAKIVEQSGSYSKSFKKRWKLTDRNQLLASATHEFVHGVFGLSFHDEFFACRLTEVMGTVMDNRKGFNWCFRD